MKILFLSRENTLYNSYSQQGGQSSTLNLTQIAQTSTLPSALELTLRHMGIALLPDVVANPRIASGELVQLVESITWPLWPAYTLHAYQGEKPVHVSRLHQLVCRFFNAL